VCVHMCVCMCAACVCTFCFAPVQPWPRGLMVEKTRNIKTDPLKDRPFSDTVLVMGL